MFRYFGIAMMSGFLEKIRGTFLKFFTSYPISTLCVSQDNLNFYLSYFASGVGLVISFSVLLPLTVLE